MPNPNKDSSMLIDIQYVRANRKLNLPDYLYLIWKDLNTNQKMMQAIPEPKMDIFFEKPEFRNHDYNKDYALLSECNKVTVKYKDIIYAIANDMGPAGINRLQEIYNTHNMSELRNFLLYPYVFGADYDIRVWYRSKWFQSFDNSRPKKLTKGFLDIEVDGLEVDGFPDASRCPINAVSIIDGNSKTVYLFALTKTKYVEKDTTNMTPFRKASEIKRRRLYEGMYEQQDAVLNNVDGFVKELHDEFDESYPDFKYSPYFYEDERKMLIHMFQLINSLKLDMIGIWNMGFDMPYIIDRLKVLGLDPAEVMCHPDFPSKECYFKKDTKNFAAKNKSDFLKLSSYTIFYCQMILYAAIRKGGKELRSTKLNYIAEKELKDQKLNYSENANIKTLAYIDWVLFLKYNIKDTLLQYGIENKVNDFDTLYTASYRNETAYENVFKQTVKLRSLQYRSYESQGLVPGSNMNMNNYSSKKDKNDDDDDDDNFEGALVADPELNDYVGISLYGVPSNNIFRYSVDMDMSAFYPSSVIGMNIHMTTLIFKMQVDIGQFDFMNGNLPLNGITNKSLKDEYDEYPDCGKEVMDNFQTGNYLSCGSKWLNLPNVNDVYERLKHKKAKKVA